MVSGLVTSPEDHWRICREEARPMRMESKLRSEDALAEEPVLLGLQRAVVDGLGLGHLTGGPLADLPGGGEADADGVEVAIGRCARRRARPSRASACGS